MAVEIRAAGEGSMQQAEKMKKEEQERRKAKKEKKKKDKQKKEGDKLKKKRVMLHTTARTRVKLISRSKHFHFFSQSFSVVTLRSAKRFFSLHLV